MGVFDRIEKFIRKKKCVFLIFACIVMIITAYSLIQPASTLDKEEAERQGGIDVCSEQEKSSAQDETSDSNGRSSDVKASQDDAAESSKDIKTEVSEITGKSKDDNTEHADAPKATAKDAKKQTMSISASQDAFDVVVTYNESALIPKDSTLRVKEYEKDTDDYNTARNAVLADKRAKDESVDLE